MYFDKGYLKFNNYYEWNEWKYYPTQELQPNNIKIFDISSSGFLLFDYTTINKLPNLEILLANNNIFKEIPDEFEKNTKLIKINLNILN